MQRPFVTVNQTVYVWIISSKDLPNEQQAELIRNHRALYELSLRFSVVVYMKPHTNISIWLFDLDKSLSFNFKQETIPGSETAIQISEVIERCIITTSEDISSNDAIVADDSSGIQTDHERDHLTPSTKKESSMVLWCENEAAAGFVVI